MDSNLVRAMAPTSVSRVDRKAAMWERRLTRQVAEFERTTARSLDVVVRETVLPPF
jgi:hypothetical protein